MANWKIYYNPKCRTCRKVLEILEEKGIKPEIVEYLKTPPTAKELNEILRKAGLRIEEIIRQKKTFYFKMDLVIRIPTRSQLLQILSDNPVFIERPIVVRGNKAIVARPPEKVHELL